VVGRLRMRGQGSKLASFRFKREDMCKQENEGMPQAESKVAGIQKSHKL